MILRPLNSRLVQMAAASALLAAGASLSRAATYTWKGGGADNSWTTAANWQGNSAPPSGNLTDLIFGNSAFTDSTLGGAFGVHSLTFASDAGVYHFSNGPLALGAGGLDEESASPQVFNVTVAMATDQTWQLASGAGQLNFFHGINTSDTGGAGHVLTINANSAGPDGNVIGGDISGKGSLVKTGTGTLTSAGLNTYTGATTVNAGTLLLGGGGEILGTSAITVNAGGTLTVNGLGQLAGAGAAALHLTGTAASLATLNLGGAIAAGLLGNASVTVPGNAFLDTNSRVSQTGGTFRSANLTLGSAGGNNVYALSGTGSVTTGALAVGDSGSGTFNQYAGTVTATSLTLGGGRGTAALGVYNLDQGTLSVGTIRGNIASTGPNGVLNFHGGTLQATANDTNFLQNVVANVRGSTDAGGVQTGGAIIDVESSASVIIAQPLLHSPVAGDPAVDGGLTKLGGGSLTLAGNSTYTGATFLGGGNIIVGTGGTAGSLGSGPVVNNATLIFNRSDDVTIANAISGTGAVALGSAGGSATLTGASTYTGGTFVEHGKVVVGSGGSIAGGTVIVASGAALEIEGTGSVSLANGSLLEVDGQGTLGGQGKVSLAYPAFIGRNAPATFTQSGGTFTNTGYTLNLGSSPGASGKYTLGGGSLSTGGAELGNGGQGTFVQTGGTFTTNGGLLVVGGSGDGGSYTLGGTGSLSTGIAAVGANAPGTFTQTGGTFTTNGNILIVGGNATGNYQLSGGTLTAATAQIGNGASTATFTQSGGTLTTGRLALTGASTASTGTYNLDGGLLTAGRVAAGYEGNPFIGTSTFNFNGGTLQASASSTVFFSGVTTANVRAGGAIIDTNGFNVTIAQPLVHDTAGGAPGLDGGLTKQGAGSLTLAALNTYTGTTTVAGGGVVVIVNGALGESDVTIEADATLSLGVAVTAAHNADADTTLTLASANTSIVNLARSGVQDVVGTLVINGVRMAAGTYGAPGSGATYTNYADFTGAGVLTVIPEPAAGTLLLAALCLSGAIFWCCRFRRGGSEICAGIGSRQKSGS